MLQNAWMSPHKPDPLPRKVDVDLSAILIRPDELNRPGIGYDLQARDVFPGAWKNQSKRGPFPRISPSEWASIVFAVGACLVGIFCTLWTFDDLEQFRQLVYPTADVIYVRPGLRASKSQRVVSQKPHFPARPQSNEPTTGVLKEATDSSNLAPPLSMFSPIPVDNSSPLLSNIASVASNGSTSAQSSGPGRSSMSEEGPSRAQGANGKQKIISQQSHANNSTSHPRRRMTSSMKTLSGRNNLANLFVNASRQSTIDNSLSRAGVIRSSSGRAAMSMHSTPNGLSMLQHQAGLNSMRMQHGMGVQSPAVAGLNIGLNGAGLGGSGAHGKGGANARR